jgi:ATP-dependent DNA helicase PIF1
MDDADQFEAYCMTGANCGVSPEGECEAVRDCVSDDGTAAADAVSTTAVLKSVSCDDDKRNSIDRYRDTLAKFAYDGEQIVDLTGADGGDGATAALESLARASGRGTSTFSGSSGDGGRRKRLASRPDAGISRKKARGRGSRCAAVDEDGDDSNRAADAGADAASEQQQLQQRQQQQRGRANEAYLELSPSQARAMRFALSGESFFLTGKAGTGKSFLLRRAIERLKEEHGRNVYVTASTGIAACAIGGTTLHRFAGLGLVDASAGPAELAKRLHSKTMHAALARWRTAVVLVVDECSMVDPVFFDQLEAVARIVRKSDAPFGGIQVVLSGDFFQLPPVLKERGFGAARGAAPPRPSILFECAAWHRVVASRVVELTETFRQMDPEFVAALEEVRSGNMTQAGQAFLDTCRRTQFNSLATIKVASDTADAVVASAPVIVAVAPAAEGDLDDDFDALIAQAAETSSSSPPPSCGARVGPPEVLSPYFERTNAPRPAAPPPPPPPPHTCVWTENDGVVRIFSRRDMASKVNMERLAVLQGAATKYDAVDWYDDFGRSVSDEERAKRADQWLAPTELLLKVGAQVMLIYNLDVERSLVNGSTGTVVGFDEEGNPRVCFWLPDGGQRTVSVERAKWDVKFGDKVIASRKQVPLLLAWAITVHKSQGMSIDRVEVCLTGMFEKGQIYVALSRARTPQGLRITGYVASPDLLAPDPRVLDFYDRSGLSLASCSRGGGGSGRGSVRR